MEVASGEHGDSIRDIVNAVKNGDCDNLRKKSPPAELRQNSTNESKNGHAKDNEDTSSKASNSDDSNCNQSLLGSKDQLSSFPTTSLQQFVILLKRTFLSTFRDPQLTRMRLVAHVGVGALLGTLYWGIGDNAAKIHSNVGCIFFMMFFTLFASMMPTILTCKY